MDTVVFVLQILMWILCPAVIGLILLQGAAGDISSAFGGGGQLDASLGVGAHRKMAQATGVLAVLFFAMVLALAYPHRKSFQDVDGAAKPAVTQPALTPAPAPTQAPAVATPPAVEAAQPAPTVTTPVLAPKAVKAEVVAPSPAEAAPAQPAAEAPKVEAPAVPPAAPEQAPAAKP